MAPTKRKAVQDNKPKKKSKPSDSGDKPQSTRNVAKPLEATKTSKPAKAANGKDETRRPTAKSILLQEERAFPRGGASVLTSLEQRQVRAEAERDALLEHETGQVQVGRDEDGDLFDDMPTVVPSKKKSKQNQQRGKSDGGALKIAGSGTRIQSLSYKNLSIGSVVLGRVTAVTAKDIALALPNNLTGYVPITAISQRLNSKIEKLLNEGEAESASDEDDDADVDLKTLFSRGQWLRAVVTATNKEVAAEGGSKSKRHIGLSLDPQAANVGLSEDNIVVDSMIQASVRSVEDHGIVMDLGLADEGIKGFVSKKELGSAYSLDELHEGQVFLALVTGKASGGKVVNLSLNPARYSATSQEKPAFLNEAPTIEGFAPGTAVNVLVIDSGPGGVAGKVMGMLDVTADVIHAGSHVDADAVSKLFKIGSKVKARIIWALPQDDDSRLIGVSMLEQTLALTPQTSKLPKNATSKMRSLAAALEQKLPLSAIVENAKVSRVMSERGLFLELPDTSTKTGTPSLGFAHISQISDKRLDSLSSTDGTYKPDSMHKARVVSYNPVDDIYYVSLKQSTLDQTFLRLEDVTIGETVKGTVEKLVLGGKGVTGALVKLSDSVTGLVPEMHLSDTQLKHPERKFREGFPVTARVLSVDLEKRHLRLTTKKSLMELDDKLAVWRNYQGLQVGMESKGTIVNILDTGAAVQFFGTVRAWLPISEMSETFVEDPKQHLRLGQTVTARILSVDPISQAMKVSCKAYESLEPEQQEIWNGLHGGDLVSGTVSEKTADSVIVDLENGIRGTIRIGHLLDGSAVKAESTLSRIRVGQKLSNLLIVKKLERSHTLLLSNKQPMIEDAQAGTLLRSFSDVQEGKKVHGFVRNITPESVYVEFANQTVGVIFKTQTLPEAVSLPDFGLRMDQGLALWITHVDPVKQRFFLSMREQKVPFRSESTDTPANEEVQNAVDPSIRSRADLTHGKVVKARIASVKSTQINLRLADGVQGRIDISEAFDSWEDIANKAAPLQSFAPNDVIDVKILGFHDARTHRFLPISHRQHGTPVFELSAKASRINRGDEALLSLDTVQPGSTYTAFINNHGENCVWASLSPNVRGRVALIDLSEDVGSLQNFQNNFRIGRAIRVQVKAVDLARGRLDLTARPSGVGLEDLTPGMTVPARVTKHTERSVILQLTDLLAGVVPLVELSDDYDQINITQHNKNDVVRACIVDTDLPNKKVFLSLRPSRVLSSSLPVKDRAVDNISQLKAGDIVRGFVKHIAEKGVFVSLGACIDAKVFISDLSDSFVKNWQTIVSVDQLVKGRVVSVNQTSKEVRLSLKPSHIEDGYKPALQLEDLEVGQVVTGKVRKVEDFGAFIDVDHTQPRVSGLCHKTEMAAMPVKDPRKLYSEGDKVKAKIIKIDTAKKRISFGLKAEYFQEEVENEHDEEVVAEGNDVEMDDIELNDIEDMEVETEHPANGQPMDLDDDLSQMAGVSLKTGGFDWAGDSLDPEGNGALSESENEQPGTKKRKRNKPEIKVDLTGDLDKFGPRSVSDFERQLLGRPNDSGLWVGYMAFQLQLNEVQEARDIAKRALKRISYRDNEELLTIWTAWLNLEVEYGDEEQVEEVFKQACQLQDSLEMHEKLVSIYVSSGKYDKADALFERMIAVKAFRASPAVWYNYASFLMDRVVDKNDQEQDEEKKQKLAMRARDVLRKSFQSIVHSEQRPLTAKFATLEFKARNGDPERGRTVFEGLVADWPKVHSIWDTWTDAERSQISRAETDDGKKAARERVRSLYERMSAMKMKKRRAKFLFKKWLEFEEQEGNEKQVDKVKAVAAEYVEKQQAGLFDDMED